MGWGTSLIKQTRSLRGIDISADAIGEARRRYGSHAQFQVGSMERLELPDESTDTIVCLEGIEHVPKDVASAFIADARRVLRHDGQLLLSSPHCSTGEHSGNPYHVYEYQPEEMRALLETCFRVEEVISRPVDNMIIHYFRSRPKE
jgi:2-polyprenyl-3-methyl-5-hydroxy-6-metoxy-1,4-benzoquinol methylase